jgi:CDP-glucose 4,6-dehydratase
VGFGRSALENLVTASRDFWRGKRVLLTGHTGFKGGWLLLWLKSMGAQVTGFALAPQGKPNLFDLACKNAADDSIIADIRDRAAVDAAFARARPEIVLHLAAQALVLPSYADPVGTYATNVMGTVHLLDAVRRTDSVRAVVNVTSDKCYENREWVWAYRENEPMGGYDPYSNSKGCSELVTAAFRQSYFSKTGAKIATGRAGNVIGGGDWAENRIVPDCIRAFQKGEPVVIRNPAAVRPWQHVLEPLSGYLLLAQRLAEGGPYAEAWNFGPGENEVKPVSYIADAATRLWGNDARWEQDKTTHPHEAHLLKIDASKARQLLKWSPRLDIDRCLEWTVQWYKRQAEGDHAIDLCLEQIEHYEAMQS